MKKYLLLCAGSVLAIMLFGAWGGTGHRIISKKTTDAFPEEMKNFRSWSTFLSSHASDADNRKGSDTTEEFRHYIDIDSYPEFLQTGRISQSLDTMNMLHGAAFVKEEGLLPWAIIRWTDSLTKLFRARNWNQAMQVAADLGHYVADGHMPLHITKNYNGQLTNQTGVHSRYESTMIGNVQSQLVFTPSVCSYVSNVPDYVFNFIYADNKYVDSVLYADSVSKARNSGSYSTKYYDTLWSITRNYTLELFKRAAERHAALIYTAWKNAGSPDTITAVDEGRQVIKPYSINMAAYPNPFNNEVKIRVSFPAQSAINAPRAFHLYNSLGREVMKIDLDAEAQAGSEFGLKCDGLASGVYYGAVLAGGQTAVTKLVLLK